jgi:hypothetical protein
MKETEQMYNARKRKVEEEDEEDGDVKKIRQERTLHVVCYFRIEYPLMKTESFHMPCARQDTAQHQAE